jgi:hypothetical protein
MRLPASSQGHASAALSREFEGIATQSVATGVALLSRNHQFVFGWVRSNSPRRQTSTFQPQLWIVVATNYSQIYRRIKRSRGYNA